MLQHIWRQVKQLVKLFVFPWPALSFFSRSVGAEYTIGYFGKARLFRTTLYNSTRAGSETTFAEQLMLVRGVLTIPKNSPGTVAEFGCFKGAATASLSAACAACNRTLMVFDSFEGLPEPKDRVTSLSTGTDVAYKAGDLTGTLDEVKKTVKASGDISVCQFVPGFFDATLPKLDASVRFAMIFEDADLPQSVQSVLRHAWPRLNDGAFFFCHEARDKEVIELFYDSDLWRNELTSKAPGYTGSGCGLPLDPRGSMLGFAVKHEHLTSTT